MLFYYIISAMAEEEPIQSEEPGVSSWPLTWVHIPRLLGRPLLLLPGYKQVAGWEVE